MFFQLCFNTIKEFFLKIEIKLFFLTIMFLVSILS